MIPLKKYLVDLRAIPDTPLEERQALRQGKTMGPQTVRYTIFAENPEEATETAILTEYKFIYREKVWLLDVKEMGYQND